MLNWLRGHRKVRESLSAYLDGELSPAQARAVESHLAGCGSCREELEGLRSVAHTLRSLPEVDPPRSFALGPQEVGPAKRPSSLERLELGLRLATAGLAVALAIVFVADLRGGRPSGSLQPEGVERAASLPMDAAATDGAPALGYGGGGESSGSVESQDVGMAAAGAPTVPSPVTQGAQVTESAGGGLAPEPQETLEPLAVAPPEVMEEAPKVAPLERTGGSSEGDLRVAKVALAAALAVCGGAAVGLALRRRRLW